MTFLIFIGHLGLEWKCHIDESILQTFTQKGKKVSYTVTAVCKDPLVSPFYVSKYLHRETKEWSLTAAYAYGYCDETLDLWIKPLDMKYTGTINTIIYC